MPPSGNAARAPPPFRRRRSSGSDAHVGLPTGPRTMLPFRSQRALPLTVGARHYYDVHQVLASVEALAGIAEVSIGALTREVCTYSHEAGLPYRERPAAGFSASHAFGEGSHVTAARDAYEERVLAQLLWPRVEQPSFDECVAAVHTHGDTL
jgi:hypothetical protein